MQGISDEFIPELVNLDELDAIIDVWDGDAIIMAQHLATELGLGVGISSGGNFLGALKLAEELGDDGAVVTVFADSNKKYFSTDLCRREPVRDDYLSPAVELLGFRSVR
jgi:cysteine synthase A